MIKPLLRKLIVAVNGSEQSLSAAMYSIMLAMQYKCELKAVYVVDTATLKQLELSKFFVPDEVARYREKLHEDGQKYLDYVKKLAAEKKVESRNFHRAEGRFRLARNRCVGGRIWG